MTEEVEGLARDAALRAAAIGLVPIGIWLMVGHKRRKELWRRIRRPDWRGEVRTGATALVLVGSVVLLVLQPWRPDPERVQGDVWLPLQDALADVTVPQDLQGWQIQGGVITQGTRRLLTSLFGTFDRSKVFYDGVIDNLETRLGSAAPARGRRDRGRAGQRPSRQHRHGRGRAQGGRRGRGHGRARRG